MVMEHPVRYEVDYPEGERDRVNVLLRPVLAIPHVVVVGGPLLGMFGSGYRTGVFGLLAATLAVLDWFAILFTGHPLAGTQELKRQYLHWRARVVAYCALLRDEYPPFGEGPYPVRLRLPDEDPAAVRDKLSVAARLLVALPHLIALVLLGIAWLVAVLVSWFAILVTGRLSRTLWQFGRDVVAYGLRLEAYLLLLHDQFPPFVLDEEALAPSAELAPGPVAPATPG